MIFTLAENGQEEAWHHEYAHTANRLFDFISSRLIAARINSLHSMKFNPCQISLSSLKALANQDTRYRNKKPAPYQVQWEPDAASGILKRCVASQISQVFWCTCHVLFFSSSYQMTSVLPLFRYNILLVYCDISRPAAAIDRGMLGCHGQLSLLHAFLTQLLQQQSLTESVKL